MFNRYHLQVEGAFVQGLGIQTLEEVVFDDAGRLVTDNTWHYKIPAPADIPRQLNVTFLKVKPRCGAVLHTTCVPNCIPSLVASDPKTCPAHNCNHAAILTVRLQKASASGRPVLQDCRQFPKSGMLHAANCDGMKPPNEAHCNSCCAQDSPNPRGIMSSKASGEPCLMLSAGVLAALQNAVAAARAEVSGTEKVGHHSHCTCNQNLLHRKAPQSGTPCIASHCAACKRRCQMPWQLPGMTLMAQIEVLRGELRCTCCTSICVQSPYHEC